MIERLVVDFWMQNWGNVASLLGLVISVWALVKSRRAIRIASLRSREADIRSGSELAADLIKAIEGQQFDRASGLARELRVHVARFSTRWEGQLDGNLSAELFTALKASDWVCSHLNNAHHCAGFDGSKLNVSEILKRTQTVSDFLSKADGKLQRQMDSRVQP